MSTGQSKPHRYRVLTEFGWDITPCTILDTTEDGRYHIEFFDNVSGNVILDTVPASAIETI